MVTAFVRCSSSTSGSTERFLERGRCDVERLPPSSTGAADKEGYVTSGHEVAQNKRIARFVRLRDL